MKLKDSLELECCKAINLKLIDTENLIEEIEYDSDGTIYVPIELEHLQSKSIFDLEKTIFNNVFSFGRVAERMEEIENENITIKDINGFYVAINPKKKIQDNDECVCGFAVKHNGKFYTSSEELTDLFLIKNLGEDKRQINRLMKNYSSVVDLATKTVSKLFSKRILLNGSFVNGTIVDSTMFIRTSCHEKYIDYTLNNWYELEDFSNIKWVNILDQGDLYIAVNQ